MKLVELSQGIGTFHDPAWGQLDIDHITHDSRRSRHGTLFVALAGSSIDGHDFIPHALQLGAVCVLTSRPERVPCNIPILEVKDERKAMARLARRLYHFPDRSLKVIGITGTNGKTTSTYVINHVLGLLGKAGRIGTVSYFNGDSEEVAARTTPESSDIFRCLGEMVANHCKYASLEVSSHGLMFDRVLGLELRYGIFTNLSRDHLDFHGDMEAYFEAKCRQFALIVEGGYAVINWDDPYGRRIRLGPGVKRIRYGQSEDADLRFVVEDLSIKGSAFAVTFEEETEHFQLPLLGTHNIYNFANAIAIGLCEGLSLAQIAETAPDVPPVPGRIEMLDVGQDFAVIIDFAHTPDALENVLKACAEAKPKRLILVFGAGGDRDLSKRKEMGAVADRYADLILLTSDNPRSEDPESIMNMVQEGIQRQLGPRFMRNWDREEMILEALKSARAGDLVLITGKGHETTQEIQGAFLPFNDRTIASHTIQSLLEAKDHG